MTFPASLEALRRAVEEEEAHAGVAQAECERVEADLADLRAEKVRAGDELEKVRDMLRGGRKADLKAQRLHALGRQRAELEVLLDNAHRDLAQAVDAVEKERDRFQALLEPKIR